jgi:hypothetical protein
MVSEAVKAEAVKAERRRQTADGRAGGRAGARRKCEEGEVVKAEV